ncbi:MAG: HEAT repeat domain-containing protein [bacterium]|nr:HEAT repeat domain-containing protein [bacterium]
MSKIFISYSHVDKDFVEKLVEHCHIADIDIWWDDSLKAGEYWSPQIDEAITNASAMILILSPNSSVSPYVTYEWAFAKGLGKKIIPVMCESINRDTQLEANIDTIKQQYGVKLPQPQIHPDFILSHRIDLSGQNNTPQTWKKLINQIHEVLGNFLLTNLSPYAPDAVKIAYADLKSSDGGKRKNAILSLSLIESPYAEDALILALEHDYLDVRWWSAEKLGKRRSIKAIPKLIKCVSDENDDIRLYAVEALIQIEDKSIEAGLIQALQDKNQDIRRKSAETLGKIGSIEAIPSLIKALDDEDNHFSGRICQILETFGTPAIPPLVIAFQDKTNSEQVRQLIATILGNIRSSEAVPVLIQFLPDDSYIVRLKIISALGDIGSSEAVPSLIDCIQDVKENIRRRATQSLGKIGSIIAIPSLILALHHDESYHVRESAALALGYIGSPESLPNLIKSLNDKVSSVQECAIRALGKLGEKGNLDAMKILIDILKGNLLLEYDSPSIQETVISTLLSMNSNNPLVGEIINKYIHSGS